MNVILFDPRQHGIISHSNFIQNTILIQMWHIHSVSQSRIWPPYQTHRCQFLPGKLSRPLSRADDSKLSRGLAISFSVLYRIANNPCQWTDLNFCRNLFKFQYLLTITNHCLRCDASHPKQFPFRSLRILGASTSEHKSTLAYANQQKAHDTCVYPNTLFTIQCFRQHIIGLWTGIHAFPATTLPFVTVFVFGVWSFRRADIN